jgi:L-arabinose isomerase
VTEQKKQELWFLTGSQHLYGDETLAEVAKHSREIAEGLDRSGKLPVRVVWKPVLTGPESILEVCLAANSAPECVGVITWMHTFSPAKMWIAGLTRLQRPLAHLHTQYNRELPWGEIDMDFMNLNQSAHGDREYGFIGARLRLNRKIVVGHWQDPDVAEELSGWARAALAMAESRKLKIARFGGMNMREVAVTGGDRVEAQIQLGWSINGYAVGDLVQCIAEVADAEVDRLVKEYEESYTLAAPLRKGGDKHESVRHAARQEIAMRTFLEAGGFGAFTTTFEDLHGLKQLPGLACQRLMASGYGFGAEGDWKTSALVRLGNVMTAGRPGGVSFIEDYTHHLVKGKERILGAHMLEVSPSIADGKPSLEVHPLGIGGKADPARLVFDARPGGERDARGHGRTHADDRGRGRRREGRSPHAEASDGARRLDPAARSQARLRGLDRGGRRASRCVLPSGDGGRMGRFRGDGRARGDSSRRRPGSARAPKRASLERPRV